MSNKIVAEGELNLDGSNWDRTIENSTKKIEHLSEHTLGGLKEAIAEAFTAGAILEAIKSAMEFGEQISNASNRLGVSKGSAQELSFAAQQAGTDLSMVESGMDKLARSKEKALDGGPEGQKLVEEFERLGVSLDDLKEKSPEELFRQLGETLEHTTVNGRVTADMMGIFGKSAGQLIPVLKELKDSASEAQTAGLILSDDDIERLHIANQALGEIELKRKAQFAWLITPGENRYDKEDRLALEEKIKGEEEILAIRKAAKDMFKATTLQPHQMDAAEQKENDKTVEELNKDTSKQTDEREEERKAARLTLEERITAELKNQKELKDAIAKGGSALQMADWKNQLVHSERKTDKLQEQHLKELFPNKVDSVKQQALHSDSLTKTGNFLGTSSNSIVAIGEQTNAILRQIHHAITAGHGAAVTGTHGPPPSP